MELSHIYRAFWWVNDCLVVSAKGLALWLPSKFVHVNAFFLINISRDRSRLGLTLQGMFKPRHNHIVLGPNGGDKTKN